MRGSKERTWKISRSFALVKSWYSMHTCERAFGNRAKEPQASTHNLFSTEYLPVPFRQ